MANDLRQSADKLIEIIDRRIDAYFKGAKVICEYVGQIQSIGVDHTANVQLLGYDTVFTFPYRDYLTNLKVGDSVKVQSKIGNLTNGVIVDRFYGGIR